MQQWYQDYPAASDFLNILFGCDSFHPGATRASTSPASATRRSTRRCSTALKTALEDEAAANKQWAKIDQEVTDAAPMATLFTPKHIDFVSKRVGNFTFSKQFYWLVSQSWVQ